MAIALIVAFDAEPTRLIQLYIVGVFVSFNLSQLGMIRHWTRALATERNAAERRRMFNSRSHQLDRADVHRRRPRRRAAHEVPGRGVDHDPRDGVLLRGHARRSRATTTRSSWSSRPTRPTTRSRPGCTPSCWSPSCTSRPCGRWRSPRPAVRTRSKASTSRSTTPTPRGCWRSGTSGSPASRSRSCTRRTARWSSRSSSTPSPSGAPTPARRRRLHPGVRRRPLVGAAPPQPDRVAAQGPAALHARGHGHVRALPAPVVADRARARGARGGPGARGDCARARRKNRDRQVQ